MSRQRATADPVGLGAGEASLVVTTAIEIPMAAQQRAGWRGVETRCNVRPGCTAMFSNVAAGDLVRDTLIAERAQQPIEYLRRVTNVNGLNDTGLLNVSADIIQKSQRASQTADPSDQIDRTIIVLG
jgi:hypothetical protein